MSSAQHWVPESPLGLCDAAVLNRSDTHMSGSVVNYLNSMNA